MCLCWKFHQNWCIDLALKAERTDKVALQFIGLDYLFVLYDLFKFIQQSRSLINKKKQKRQTVDIRLKAISIAI